MLEPFIGFTSGNGHTESLGSLGNQEKSKGNKGENRKGTKSTREGEQASYCGADTVTHSYRLRRWNNLLIATFDVRYEDILIFLGCANACDVLRLQGFLRTFSCISDGHFDFLGSSIKSQVLDTVVEHSSRWRTLEILSETVQMSVVCL